MNCFMKFIEIFSEFVDIKIDILRIVNMISFLEISYFISG